MQAKQKTKYGSGGYFDSERQDYMTPLPEVINPILKFAGMDVFDLDVCCSKTNIPAEKHFIRGKFDGLQQAWNGVCWMNPPYNTMEDWVKKAYYEACILNRCEVYAIVPARTETAYWQICVAENTNCFIVNLKKGVSFIDPATEDYCKNTEGKVMPYKNPLAIVYFGKNAEKYAKRWNEEMPIRGKAWRIA